MAPPAGEGLCTWVLGSVWPAVSNEQGAGSGNPVSLGPISEHVHCGPSLPLGHQPQAQGLRLVGGSCVGSHMLPATC